MSPDFFSQAALQSNLRRGFFIVLSFILDKVALGDNVMDAAKKQIEQAAAVLIAAGAREVYVFGSAAAGRTGEPHDIDLAVSGLAPEKFFRAMSAAAILLDRPLDLIDLDERSIFSEYLRSHGKLQRVA